MRNLVAFPIVITNVFEDNQYLIIKTASPESVKYHVYAKECAARRYIATCNMIEKAINLIVFRDVTAEQKVTA